jgi:hypothetical protein
MGQIILGRDPVKMKHNPEGFGTDQLLMPAAFARIGLNLRDGRESDKHHILGVVRLSSKATS